MFGIGRGPESDFAKSNNSFSGADMRVTIAVPGGKDGATYHELGNLQTVTYSVFREKSPARALGFVGEKGRGRGTRTVAGSLIFTVFDRHVFWDIMRVQTGDSSKNAATPTGLTPLEYVLADQLPPFDLLIHFHNEYGYSAEMALFGIEVSAEGQVMSIQDMITENTMQFTARHMTIMRPGGYRANALSGPSSQATSFASIMKGSKSTELQGLVRKAHNPFR
tara:strand:+ start:260 stop:925 length:666 start_codon:yes stop_codon:yes gene_type:complete